jgi:general secretion pathway protein J
MTPHARGFTLIEVLVAMSVFAIMALAAAGIASAALDRRTDLDAVDTRLKQVQLSHALIKADLDQIVLRPTRDVFGAARPTDLGGQNQDQGQSLLSFVRGGWANPGGIELRPSLQYVAYVIEDGALVRKSRAYLDPTPDTPTTVTTMLDGVTAAHVLFFAGEQWLDRKQVPFSPAAPLPQALALDLSVTGLGDLRFAFMVQQP